MIEFRSCWHRFLHHLCTLAWFQRVEVVHRERLPGKGVGPVLYLSLHRNGAVDGFVLHHLFPRVTFLIASQLLRSRFLRIFFVGIEVARTKDNAAPRARRALNDEAFDECQQYLSGGGELAIFPEGTSTLGPRHLPFHSGAARILLRYLRETPGTPIAVVPLGLHYERAWAFRRKMQVVVGSPIDTELAPGLTPRQELNQLRLRIAKGLEEVGAEFDSIDAQEDAEALAYATTLGTNRSYGRTLMHLARAPDPSLTSRWKDIDEGAARHHLWRHQGVPLLPLERWHLPCYLACLLLLAPIVTMAAVLNAPPLLVTRAVARRQADDRNVIALWSLLVGMPLTAIWALLMGVLIFSVTSAIAFPIYLVTSILGLLLYYRTRKIAITVCNGLRAPASLRGEIIQFYHFLQETSSHEHGHHTETSGLDTTPRRARGDP